MWYNDRVVNVYIYIYIFILFNFLDDREDWGTLSLGFGLFSRI